MVTPFLFPSTVHLKVKGSPGQVGEAVINCPLTTLAYVDRNTVSLPNKTVISDKNPVVTAFVWPSFREGMLYRSILKYTLVVSYYNHYG